LNPFPFLIDVEIFLLSDNDNPKKDAAAACLLGSSTTSKGHPQEQAVVAKSPPVPPKKISSAPAPVPKRPKRVTAMTISLEVHRPTTSSDNVSVASCTRLFLFVNIFLILLFLQTLIQKFLSLGNECVKIQETADASQGMFIIISNSLILRYCLFYFLLVTEFAFSPFVVL
jgi:hypothetical protein